jgi:tight adherence protein B
VRRLLPLLLALVAAALLPLTASGAALATGSVRLTEAGNAKFPNRAFVLSLPGARQLGTGQVDVTENGQPVADLTVVPATEAGVKTFGVVLVVDASDSMAGLPIRQAVAAERAFAARRGGRQQLGVVAFSSAAKVVLPLTSNPDKIDAALAATPQTSFGTHIYDAIARAEAMLADAHIGSGSIVVLSDGADTGSTATATQVANAATAEHVRLYTIGLQSKAFKPHTLEALATVGGGQYALARTTDDLTPLFDQLGQLLSRQYLVSYKSLAGPKTPVKVTVDVPGAGTAGSEYQTPALPATTPPPPYRPSLTTRVLGSWITMVVLALLGAAVAAFLVYAVARPMQSGLPTRMSEFVSVPGLQSHRRRPGAALAAQGEDEAADEPVKAGPIARLEETLEIARVDVTASRLIALTAAGTALLFVLLWLAFSPWWALVALVTPLCVRSWVLWRLARRRKAFAEQLPDMLQVVSAALRSGQSFAGAFAVVVESSGEPMKSEMQTVVADEQLGVPLSKAMEVVVRRMDNRDLEQIALVAELQREAGGNSAEVIDRVAETVRGRFELRRLINTLTAQGRMSRWIVTALPIALVLLITLINPHYMHPLVTHLLGKVMIVLAVLLVIGGSLVIKKIVDIKV